MKDILHGVILAIIERVYDSVFVILWIVLGIKDMQYSLELK